MSKRDQIRWQRRGGRKKERRKSRSAAIKHNQITIACPSIAYIFIRFVLRFLNEDRFIARRSDLDYDDDRDADHDHGKRMHLSECTQY